MRGAAGHAAQRRSRVLQRCEKSPRQAAPSERMAVVGQPAGQVTHRGIALVTRAGVSATDGTRARRMAAGDRAACGIAGVGRNTRSSLGISPAARGSVLGAPDEADREWGGRVAIRSRRLQAAQINKSCGSFDPTGLPCEIDRREAPWRSSRGHPMTVVPADTEQHPSRSAAAVRTMAPQRRAASSTQREHFVSVSASAQGAATRCGRRKEPSPPPPPPPPPPPYSFFTHPHRRQPANAPPRTPSPEPLPFDRALGSRRHPG